jgi:sigma-B regulation protein RsbU (phosphoserine phosphatase)
MDTDRLRRLAGELREREEVVRGIRLASSRQRNMMPPDPQMPGYDFYTVYNPVANVSGDFYDFFLNASGNLGIVIGDVSGHGVEAGIIMGMAKATVSIYGRQYDSPHEVLSIANRDLYSTLDGKTFVSLCYAVLDTENRKLRIARAGQNPPLIFNPRWKDPTPKTISSRGLALGVDRGKRFEKVLEEAELQLYPGDLCLQLTDGVTEACNVKKEQYGDERVVQMVKQYGRLSVREVTEIILEHLKDFTRGAEIDDDITFVNFKVVK